jgi:hypothetical protein
VLEQGEWRSEVGVFIIVPKETGGIYMPPVSLGTIHTGKYKISAVLKTNPIS